MPLSSDEKNDQRSMSSWGERSDSEYEDVIAPAIGEDTEVSSSEERVNQISTTMTCREIAFTKKTDPEFAPNHTGMTRA